MDGHIGPCGDVEGGENNIRSAEVSSRPRAPPYSTIQSGSVRLEWLARNAACERIVQANPVTVPEPAAVAIDSPA